MFDAYGFSPRAAIDGQALAAEIEAGASDLEIQDLREEMSMTRYVTDPVEEREYRAAWRASGVTCIFQNAGEEGQDPLRLLKRLARFTFATDMLRGFVSKASVPDDILQAKRIDHVAKKFGADHVAIGTDVAYSSQNMATQQSKVPRTSPARTPFRSLWPTDDFKTSPSARDSLAWTNWPLFTVGLVQRGYADDEIRKILSGNVLRVARASLNLTS